VIPVGQVLVLHFRLWMHPNAKSMARAELHTSAPMARVRTTENPVNTFPAAMIFTWSLSPAPFRSPCARVRASAIGIPTEFENSGGAAPVPPSAPSMVMKSGAMPVVSIALIRAENSSGFPTHSLNPTGLPPLSSRSFAMNSHKPSGL